MAEGNNSAAILILDTVDFNVEGIKRSEERHCIMKKSIE